MQITISRLYEPNTFQTHGNAKLETNLTNERTKSTCSSNRVTPTCDIGVNCLVRRWSSNGLSQVSYTRGHIQIFPLEGQLMPKMLAIFLVITT